MVFLNLGNLLGSNTSFIENKGQWPSQVKFKANTSIGALYLEENGFTHHFFEFGGHFHPDGEDTELDEQPEFKESAIRTTFLNANRQATIKSTVESSTYYNYYLGNDPNKWASGAKAFEEITYNSIYDKIDLKIYHTSNDAYKYDYIIKPFGDPSVIKNQYSHFEAISITDEHLIITHSLGQLIEIKPFAYQIINGERKEVLCQYELNDDVVSFHFPNGYDQSKELVIDPELIFSTFSGATRNNFGMTATYDEFGNGYTGGVIYGAGYPFGTVFSDSSYNGGTVDVAISKYTDNGQALIYTTYYGGGQSEMIHSMVVNDNDELIFFGTTSSNNLPTINPVDGSFNGGSAVSAIQFFSQGSDMYAARIRSDGRQFLSSTYLGGSENDGLNLSSNTSGSSYSNGLLYGYGDQARGEVNVDANGNVFIISSTYSTDFPIVNGLFSTLSGQQDVVVLKLGPQMDTLLWSTYLGGSDDDAGYSIKINSLGQVYVAGGTKSNNFPLGNNNTPLQANFNGGLSDGYIIKIANDGSTLEAGTYLGTSNYDQTFFVEVDRFDGIYAFGHSAGGAFPVFNANYVNASSGQFIIKLDSNLSTSTFSTTVGSRLGNGKIDISPTAFLVDKCQNIYIAGWGNTLAGGLETQPLSAQMPITADALKSNTHGYNFYLMVLSRDAESLEFASFFGGGSGTSDHVDGGTSRFDQNGIIYQSVCADCRNRNDFQLSNALFPINVSPSCSNALFKIDLEVLPTATITVDADSVCAPSTVNFETAIGQNEYFYWKYGNGQIDSTNKNISQTYTQQGLYSVQLIIGDSICGSSDTTIKNIYVFTNDLTINPLNDTIVCTADSVTLTASYSGTALDIIWSLDTKFDNRLNPVGVPSINVRPLTQTTYYLKIKGPGCSVFDTVVVSSNIVVPKFSISDSAACMPADFQFFDLSENYDSLSWNFGNGLISNQFNPLVTFDSAGKYLIKLTAFNSACGTDSMYTDSIEVYQSVDIDNLNDTIVCNGGDVIITPNDKGTANNYIWSNSSNFSDTITNSSSIFIPNIQTTKAYYLKASNENCDTIISFVITTPTLNVTLEDQIKKCVKDTIEIKAIAVSSSNNISYKWTPSNFILGSDTTNSIRVKADQNITYHLDLYTDEGCRFEDSVKVSVSSPLVGQLFPFTTTDTVPLGKTIRLESDIKQPYFNYYWRPEQLVETPFESSTLTVARFDTIYTLTILDDSTGCSYNGSLRIGVYDDQCADPFVFVPTAFTPNNDGNNDHLYVRGPNISTLTFQVFNRWGELVFETNNINQGWDGTFKGKEAPPAVYAYQLKAVCYNGTTYFTKGDVTLIR